ncbi:hypothetical protein C8R46DRAFT_1347443 [Mycena filopes]|nr:hypothetical protein C8R46DRAFT_1347443 [Mycena filopes]
MFLSAATKSSLTEVLGLVQKTVLNAASELEDEAQSQVARLNSQVNEARSERDDALKSLHVAQIAASTHGNELAHMRATVSGFYIEETLSNMPQIENLQREVVHWKEQAKNWQDHYTRVEQDRCGLSTELLTLSRSALTESPPKHYSTSAPNSHMKRASTSSNRPPAYKSAIPPSPSESDSPLQSVSTPRNPRTPASKPARQQPTARSELPAYPSDDATSVSASVVNRSGGVQQQHPPRSAKAAGKQPQVQTPSQAPRQIFVRRVHAVVHVKEEEGDDDFEDEEPEEIPDANVRLVKRRRSGLMIQDDDDEPSGSGSEAEGGGPRGRDEESGDELMMNPRQEVYGGVHPVLPTPQPTLRLKRLANAPPQAEASPTKRRRVSDAARVKAPAKKK